MSNIGVVILGCSALIADASGNSISAAVYLAGAFIVLSIGELTGAIKAK